MKYIILVSFIHIINCEFTLNILHLNDFHCRFEETSIYSGRCGERDKSNNNCYGGFARIHYKVKELRESLDNTVFLAAGDYYQGTVWYSIHKWQALAYFLNIIDHDAMVLGNHEFDDGIEGVVPFLDNVTFPVIVSNINDSLEPSFQGKTSPSVVKILEGKQVGIIGFTTTETEFISNPGNLMFLDEEDSVRKEAKRLKAEGVDIIIALGHAGFRKDMQIAENVEEVDIVVGGHTNTFLYTGDEPSTESSAGEYPTVITQVSGKKVLVVQAYAFGKYLGHLEVTFDDDGEIISWNGNPILLDNSVPQDQTILSELIPWKAQLTEVISETVGRTFVFLDGNRLSCRMKECNLGNLEADAIVHQNAKYPDDMEWAQTSLAVVNGGSIRSSINEQSSNGSISIEDIMEVAPFENTIDIVELKGKHVRELFETSVSNYDTAGLDPPGGFLQVSGFRVVYDLDNDAGSRVVMLLARCVACRIPELKPVDDDEIYKIAMPSFIANGGDGFNFIRDKKVTHHLTGLLDTDIFIQYVSLYSPIYQGIEHRIQFVSDDNPCDDRNCYSTSTQSDTDCHKKTVTEFIKANNGNAQELNMLMSLYIITLYILLLL